MLRRSSVIALLLISALTASACGRGDDSEEGGGGDATSKEIVIGWTPPDITGVFKTATDFFEQAAQDANDAGFNVEVVSRSPATHTAFADQLAIIEDFISQQV